MNECAMCKIKLTPRHAKLCEKRGDSPLCKECRKDLKRHFAEEERREQAYLDARIERVAKEEQERQEWRIERYEQRREELEEQNRRVQAYRDEQLEKSFL